MKPDTLEIADAIVRGNYSMRDLKAAAAELRRLHEVNQMLVEALEIIAGKRMCVDSLLSNREIAEAALAKAGEQK